MDRLPPPDPWIGYLQRSSELMARFLLNGPTPVAWRFSADVDATIRETPIRTLWWSDVEPRRPDRWLGLPFRADPELGPSSIVLDGADFDELKAATVERLNEAVLDAR